MNEKGRERETEADLERKNQRTKTERNKFSSETILCCNFCPSEGLILKNLQIRNVYAADVKRIGIKLF